MFIIMSGAYVCSELRSEFGSIPPAMLPLGNVPLYHHQISLFAPYHDEGVIVLPYDYQLSQLDLVEFEARNVRVFTIDSGLSVGAALCHVSDALDDIIPENVSIMWGDTLVTGISSTSDVISVESYAGAYNWGYLSPKRLNCELSGFDELELEPLDVILTGFFSFSSFGFFIRLLKTFDFNLVEALTLYSNHHKLILRRDATWLDFGHGKTFFRSKAHFTTQRSFNSLLVTHTYVEKSSQNWFKIFAESEWFRRLPDEFRIYVPAVLGCNFSSTHGWYRLEYLYLNSLSELYVFSKLDSYAWEVVLDNCFSFLNASSRFCSRENGGVDLKELLFIDKTEERLKQFSAFSGLSLDIEFTYDSYKGTIRDVFDRSVQSLPISFDVSDLMHGDFCFSNILFDFRSQLIKVIDPRGFVRDGIAESIGCLFYDLCKLAHSIDGLYDFIICGRYALSCDNQNSLRLSFEMSSQREEFISSFYTKAELMFGYTKNQIVSGQIILFLSMLPLHSDNPQRQRALLANAFRLVSSLQEGS